MEYEVTNADKQLDIERSKTLTIIRELEELEKTAGKLDEVTFSLEKIREEKEFYQQQHDNLRRVVYQWENHEFPLQNLKRDLYYRQEQIGIQEQRIAELQR